MASSDSSQHVPAFVGHLLTNPAVRDAAEAAGKATTPEAYNAAIAKVINDHLGTNLSPDEARTVAEQAKAQLKALKASPQTVSDAESNIIFP